MRISDWSSDVCSSDLLDLFDHLLIRCRIGAAQVSAVAVRRRRRSRSARSRGERIGIVIGTIMIAGIREEAAFAIVRFIDHRRDQAFTDFDRTVVMRDYDGGRFRRLAAGGPACVVEPRASDAYIGRASCRERVWK